MKKYILLSASTGSEWDAVEYALLPFSKKRLNSFVSKKRQLLQLEDVNELIVYADEVDFFIDKSELPERVESDQLSEASGIVIELTDEEYGNLRKPEQTIKYGHVSYSREEVKFSGFGKHTDEEFWASLNFATIEKFLEERSLRLPA